MRPCCLAPRRARPAHLSACSRRGPSTHPLPVTDHPAHSVSRTESRKHHRQPGPPGPPTQSWASDDGQPRLRCWWGGGVLVASLVSAGLVLAALPASAATVHVVALAGSLEQVLSNLRNWIMGILALVATVFLTIGGVRYVVSSGDAGEVSKAKDCFKNAGLGYALAALAPLVVQILRGIVGA